LLWAGCSFGHPSNSIKALEETTETWIITHDTTTQNKDISSHNRTKRRTHDVNCCMSRSAVCSVSLSRTDGANYCSQDCIHIKYVQLHTAVTSRHFNSSPQAQCRDSDDLIKTQIGVQANRTHGSTSRPADTHRCWLMSEVRRRPDVPALKW